MSRVSRYHTDETLEQLCTEQRKDDFGRIVICSLLLYTAIIHSDIAILTTGVFVIQRMA